MKDRRRMRGGSAWLLGFAAGIAGTLALLELAMIGVMTYVVMLLWLARVRAIPTFGGAFTATGLWFVFLWWRSLAQCAAFMRTVASARSTTPGSVARSPSGSSSLASSSAGTRSCARARSYGQVLFGSAAKRSVRAGV